MESMAESAFSKVWDKNCAETRQLEGNAVISASVVLRDSLDLLAKKIELAEAEHKVHLELLHDPSLSGLAGHLTNQIFNKPAPDMTIWLNAHSLLASARYAAQSGDLRRSLALFLQARRQYLLSAREYVDWKAGLEEAEPKMHAAVAAVSAGAVLAFVAPGVLAAFSADAPEAVAVQQTLARIEVAVTNADTVMLNVEQTITAEELMAQAELEVEMELLQLLRF
jgi:hypothetical protein